MRVGAALRAGPWYSLEWYSQWNPGHISEVGIYLKVIPHSMGDLVIPQAIFRGYKLLLSKDLRVFFASVLLLVHLIVIGYFVKGSLYYYQVFAYSKFDPSFFQVHFLGILPVSIFAGLLGVLGYFVALSRFNTKPNFSTHGKRWLIWSYLIFLGMYLVSTLGWCMMVDAPNAQIQNSFYLGNSIGGVLALLGIAGLLLRYKYYSIVPRWLSTVLTMFLIFAGSLFLFGIGKTTVWNFVDLIQ